MAIRFKSGLAALVVVVAILVAGAFFRPVRQWFGFEGPAIPTDSRADDRTPGFHERALQSGLTFRMHFLPAEQGETFKINLYDHGCGVAVGDYDGDGYDDIYFVNQLGPNALYRNKGDGTFVDVTAKAGVILGDRVCVGATFADYDNDGKQDLFVTSTRGGNVLFHNEGNGTFKDVTEKAGVSHVGHSQTAVFFDYDNDGYLDLFLIHTAKWTLATFDKVHQYYPGKTLASDDFMHSPIETNILYHNNGNGTFTDVSEKSGLKGHGWSGDVAVFDYNGDGYFDVLVTMMFGPSQLYKNNGNGTFAEVTKETIGPSSYGGIGAKVFDFNNDGKLDILIADMHSDMWTGLDRKNETLELAKAGQHKKYPHLGGPMVEKNPELKDYDKLTADLFGYKVEDVIFGNTFFKNLGGGKFQEMSDRANLETFWPWGIASGDFDNNGYEDVFLASGMGYPFYYWPNQLLMNTGEETFVERAEELGVEPPERGVYVKEKIGGKPACRSSRCAAVADFDGDGRLEIVVNNFNDQPYYFRNNLPPKNWIAFRLRGTKSNRDAIGAVMKLYIGKEILTRQLCPAGGYLSQSSKTLHFGLGDRTKIDRIEIKWPSGLSEDVANWEINKLQPEIVESKK